VPRLTAAAARRIALAAQGFCDPRPRSAVDVRHLRRALDRMTILQLDSVNVVCRSHYLPVLARLGPYDRDKLDRYLYRSGERFEYLSHEASLTSQDLHPYLRWRMARTRWRQAELLEEELPGYTREVLEEVTERGPLSISDLSDPGSRTGPWWGRSKGKVALDALYVSGRLAISHRTGSFVIVYDRPERVLRPGPLAAPTVDEPDAHRHLLALAARSHGIGTDADLADYFRLRRTDARRHLDDLVAVGELERVEVDGWDAPAYLHPEARRPRRITGRALLSPFDPVVWFRPRAERLFRFRYRIEIYVPAAKRVHGYYVLPFLLDDHLVARVDLKADRAAGVLRVRGAFAEDGHDAKRTAAELAGALAELAEWLDLDAVAVEDRGDLARELAAATSVTAYAPTGQP
jgi:uncharacterized protein YcaQ